MDNTTSITLTSLIPYTLYSLQVKAVNSFGAGPASEQVSTTTLEDGKKRLIYIVWFLQWNFFIHFFQKYIVRGSVK